MKSKHWNELMLPSLLLGGAWLLVSGASTVYIYWLDSFHQRLLTDNVESIRAVARMQHAIWKIRSKKEEALEDFREAFVRARRSATTPKEQPIIAAIEQHFKEFMAIHPLDAATLGADSLALLDQVADDCERFRRINVDMMEKGLSDHKRWVSFLGWGRFAIVVCGPFVGVWLGYRVAGRFGDRIAAINLTLDGSSREFGEVQVMSSAQHDDLDELDRQVQTIAGRIQTIVTQLDDARKEVVRNERLAAIGHLAAGVAHEIRNPLTAVKLLVQNASQKASSNAWTVEHSQVVREEISRIERIIQDLLDFAKPTTSQQIHHDVGKTIQRAVRLVQGRAEQSQIQIETTSGGPPVYVVGDPEQLHQVFVNLLMNGMDATSPGGKLSIEICQDASESARNCLTDLAVPESIAQADTCKIAVRDDGKGIPPDLLARIFEPFVTDKASGTGLGLAISRQIVEAHGGTLTAVNRSDHGAEFVICLPIARVPPLTIESNTHAIEL